MSGANAEATELRLGYVVRPMEADEIPWVAKSWRLSLRFGPHYRHMYPARAFALINPIVDSKLDNPDVNILVARDSRAELGVQTIFGFIAYTGRSLHYAVTRRPFRRQGICVAMLDAVSPSLRWYTTRSGYDWFFEASGMKFAGENER